MTTPRGILYLRRLKGGSSLYYLCRGSYTCPVCGELVTDDIADAVFSWRRRAPPVFEVLHLPCMAKGCGGRRYVPPLFTITQAVNKVILCDVPPPGATPHAFFPPELVSPRRELSVYDLGGITAELGPAPGDDEQLRRLRAGRPEYTVLDDNAPVVLGDAAAVRWILAEDAARLSIAGGLAFLDTLQVENHRAIIDERARIAASEKFLLEEKRGGE